VTPLRHIYRVVEVNFDSSRCLRTALSCIMCTPRPLHYATILPSVSHPPRCTVPQRCALPTVCHVHLTLNSHLAALLSASSTKDTCPQLTLHMKLYVPSLRLFHLTSLTTVDQIPKDYSHQAEQQSRVSRTLAGVSGLSEATFRGFQNLQANVAFAVVDTALLGNRRFNKRRHSLLFNDAVSTVYVARRH